MIDGCSRTYPRPISTMKREMSKSRGSFLLRQCRNPYHTEHVRNSPITLVAGKYYAIQCYSSSLASTFRKFQRLNSETGAIEQSAADTVNTSNSTVW